MLPDAPAVTGEPRAVRLGRDTHVNVLLAGSRALGAVEDICRAHGLTHAQYVALWTLCLSDDAERGLPVGAVADGLLNPAADATRLIDRLARAGLAERLPNPEDRRGVLVRATPAGRRRFAAVTPDLQAFHRRQWAELTTTEVETLNRLLRKALWGDAPDPRPAGRPA